MAVEQVDLRRFRAEPEVKADEIVRRRAHFTSLGFTDEWIEVVSAARPTLWAPEVVDDH